jgi:hypothetical protein
LPELLSIWTDSGDFSDDESNKPLLTYFLRYLIDIKSIKYNKCNIIDDLELNNEFVYTANFSITHYDKLYGENLDNIFYIIEVHIKDRKWLKGRPVIQSVFSIRDLDKKLSSKLESASSYRKYIIKSSVKTYENVRNI